MIIQALADYCDRKTQTEVDWPPYAFSREKIHFALIINPVGKLIQVQDLRTEEKDGKELLVPRAFKRAGKNVIPNFLWDNTGYVLGNDQKEKPKNAEETFKAFQKFHVQLLSETTDSRLKAVELFLEKWHPRMVEEFSNWDDIAGKNLVFQLDGEREFVHQREEAKRLWLKYYESKVVASFEEAMCLVSGDKNRIPNTHASIKRVLGAQSSGAAIISFNLDSFESYGKKQNLNAPVSERIEFSYTTALNELLRRNSRQHVQIGDATTVFWAQSETPVVSFLKDILDPRDDGSANTDLRQFLEAVREGKMPGYIKAGTEKFYILGLSPNASRLAVRFWYVSTVEELSQMIGQHFNDMRIVKSYENESEFPGMWQLLREMAVRKDIKNLSPLLAGAVMRSILTGAAYPQALLSSVVGRIRADQEINYYRAALIKACIVRAARSRNIKREVSMGWNKDEKNIAYRLGGLFAVLEKAQKDAVPGANSTIKDRFYGSASATPSVVFPQLMRLAQHHIQKSDYGVNIEKSIEEILGDIQKFPTHLSLEDQGFFAIGYYHKKQDFFKKS